MNKYKYAGLGGVIALLVAGVAGMLLTSKDGSETSRQAETRGKKEERSGQTKTPAGNADLQSKNGKETKPTAPKARMTPELATARLKEYKEIKDISIRAMKCHEVIRELCANGYIEEAWALIDRDFGKVRVTELDAFFGSLKVDIATFEARLKELDNKGEARDAMNSRMENYNASEIVKALMSPDGGAEFQVLKNLDFDGFSNAVYNRLHFNLSSLPVEEREARLADTHTLQQKGLVRPVELIRMLYKLGNYSAFQTWDKFSQYSAGVDYGSDRGFIDHTRENIINRMVKESSVETMGLMLKSPEQGRSRDIQIAIGTWAELDSRGASDWYENNASTLSPENKSSVAAGFFGEAYDSNEFEVAKQWAEQISDSKMRDAALAAIEKKAKIAEIK